MTSSIRYEKLNNIATITLNRPAKLNALDDEMIAAIVDLLDDCRRDDEVKVIVITGTGRAFCSGGDAGRFGARTALTPAMMKRKMSEGIQRLPKKFGEVEKPLVAAINGLAYGAGLDLAMMCDLRFAAESAKLAESYARMAIIPGAGGAWYLPRLVGSARALEMFWTTEPVTGPEAERIGLVNKAFPDAELMEKTYAIAQKIARGAPLSIGVIKSLVYHGMNSDLRTSLDLVASNVPVVRTSEDHLEALAAFNEKRSPQFKGR